ncbi:MULTISPECIES: hypothetical protein [unclassified Sphingomonas]|uniref:hypothetical protein n=1 Tax=unclassified Sphingomonas TaxID=196159 RepID=UPI0022B43729|nr:hypothetical protein [Sphingomonas sp. NIBR02145]WHU01856.1 hypothetical protein O3305_16900 [Sphingomonas sp. NIBR02145]
MRSSLWIGLATAMLATSPAFAQDKQQSTAERAGDIAEQPAKDVGAVKTKIPPVLQKAAAAPYSLSGLSKCTQIADAFDDLGEALGPDFVQGVNRKKSRKVKVTGDTVAGLIVPFRGLVREVSGAASAQRELNAAVDAGFARRGFLRGVYQTRGCKPAL